MNIPVITLEKLPNSTYLDPIGHIIHKYSKHPSILKINEMFSPTETFSFFIVDQSQIEKEIMDLNPKKPAGTDFIPTNVIKDSVTVLKTPFTQLINNSVEECHFLSDLKYANVTLLYKKYDDTNKENYRPISILPSISKVTFYVPNKFSTYLCGFRKGYNAQHAL